jgi:hypothetical protein
MTNTDENITQELERLKSDNSPESTKKIGEIGFWVVGQATAALQILSGREGHTAINCIGMIGWYVKSNGSAALEILSGREGDEATRWIGQIGLHVEGQSLTAMKILSGREGYEDTRWITEILDDYPIPYRLSMLANFNHEAGRIHAVETVKEALSLDSLMSLTKKQRGELGQVLSRVADTYPGTVPDLAKAQKLIRAAGTFEKLHSDLFPSGLN